MNDLSGLVTGDESTMDSESWNNSEQERAPCASFKRTPASIRAAHQESGQTENDSDQLRGNRLPSIGSLTVSDESTHPSGAAKLSMKCFVRAAGIFTQAHQNELSALMPSLVSRTPLSLFARCFLRGCLLGCFLDG